jgi:hypothetical protein
MRITRTPRRYKRRAIFHVNIHCQQRQTKKKPGTQKRPPQFGFSFSFLLPVSICHVGIFSFMAVSCCSPSIVARFVGASVTSPHCHPCVDAHFLCVVSKLRLHCKFSINLHHVCGLGFWFLPPFLLHTVCCLSQLCVEVGTNKYQCKMYAPEVKKNHSMHVSMYLEHPCMSRVCMQCHASGRIRQST